VDPNLITALISVGGPLAGVVLGALLAPMTQLYLERKQEQGAADRAKRLVAGELLHAQLVLRAISEGEDWPPIEDVNAYLPISDWQENKSSLVGKIDDDLWNRLVLAYAGLQSNRAQLAMVKDLPPGKPLPAKKAESLKENSNKLGRLRRELGGGGGWLEEIDDEVHPQRDSLEDAR
jgi:hypothetical protein